MLTMLPHDRSNGVRVGVPHAAPPAWMIASLEAEKTAREGLSNNTVGTATGALSPLPLPSPQESPGMVRPGFREP